MVFFGHIYREKFNRGVHLNARRHLFKETFETRSRSSAKAHLTRLANQQELFTWVSWDNVKRTYTAKDLNWSPWHQPIDTEGSPVQKALVKEDFFREAKADGTLNYTSKTSETYVGDATTYRVTLALYWRPIDES